MSASNSVDKNGTDRFLRLLSADPLDAYEEGVRVGWNMALAWFGASAEGDAS